MLLPPFSCSSLPQGPLFRRGFRRHLRAKSRRCAAVALRTPQGAFSWSFGPIHLVAPAGAVRAAWAIGFFPIAGKETRPTGRNPVRRRPSRRALQKEGSSTRRPHCDRRRDKVNWSEGPREGPLGGSERNRRKAAALSAEMAAKYPGTLLLPSQPSPYRNFFYRASMFISKRK